MDLLDKRLKLEGDYHKLLDQDFGRFTVKDLQEFMEYLDSEQRDIDQKALFPNKHSYELVIDGFNLFDIMNWLERKRNGN